MNNVLKLIHENQASQGFEEKNVIIEDMDEIPTDTVSSKKGNPYANVVTTIHEQQTWEDMEDDFDEEFMKRKLQPQMNESSEIVHLCS